jgi:hypothetical protein
MEKYKKETLTKVVVMCATALFLLWHHFYSFSTHFGFDDMHYAKLAHAVSVGTFETTMDHYTHRWGFIFPVGWMYQFFGVSDFTSAIIPMLMTLLTVLLVWKMSATYAIWMRLWAVIFLITSEWVLFYSDKLMPDITVMFVATLIIYAYWSVVYHEMKAWKGSVVTAFAVFYCFITKETIILILPLLLIWFLIDVFYFKRNVMFWKWTLLFGLAIFGLYFGYSFIQAGDPMFRLKAIVSNGYFSACSYDVLPVSHLLKRIGYELWLNFIGNGIFLGVLFIIPLLWTNKILSKATLVKEDSFWILNAVILLLLSNFMTSTPNTYTPLCLDIRHYLFVVPSIALASGIGIQRFLSSSIKYKFAGIVVAICIFVIAFIFKLGHVYQYLVIALLLGFYQFSKSKSSSSFSDKYFWMIMFLILLYTPYSAYQDAKNYNYDNQKILVNKHLKDYNKKSKLLIITNPVEKNIDEYILGYDYKNIEFVSFKNVTDSIVSSSDSVLMIGNGMTSYLSNLQWEDLPEWVKTPDATTIKIDSLEKIDWYVMNKNDLLGRIKLEQQK